MRSHNICVTTFWSPFGFFNETKCATQTSRVPGALMLGGRALNHQDPRGNATTPVAPKQVDKSQVSFKTGTQ